MQILTEADLREMGLMPAVVCRGRSVHGPIYGTGEPNPDNPEHTIGTSSRRYQPGEVVWMVPDEAQRLRSLGYVLDPELDAEAITALRAPPPPPDAVTRIEMRKPEDGQQLLFGRRGAKNQ